MLLHLSFVDSIHGKASALWVSTLGIVALLALRRRPLDAIPRFLWALLIILAPILGPVVFFIVRPENLDAEQRKTV
jgi:hypothetical protein